MNSKRLVISRIIGAAISIFMSDSSILSMNSFASLIEKLVKSTTFFPSVLSFFPFINTRSASGFKRFPSHSGHTSSEKRDLVPSPLHAIQAPYGLLNENRRGSTSGNEAPSSGQMNFAESVSCVPSACRIFTSPSLSFSASSSASDKRSRAALGERTNSLTKIESTTASMS